MQTIRNDISYGISSVHALDEWVKYEERFGNNILTVKCGEWSYEEAITADVVIRMKCMVLDQRGSLLVFVA